MNSLTSSCAILLELEKVNAVDLEQIYGKSIKPSELAKFLGVDARTVKKYYERWGGVEIAPGHVRFFEKRVLEVLNAELDYQAWEETIPRKCYDSRNPEAKTVPRLKQEIVQGSGGMGKRDKQNASTESVEDKFGIF